MQLKINLLFSFFLLFCNNVVAEQVCSPNGYTIGYFNGVFKDKEESEIAIDDLSYTLPQTINNERVSVELFYNNSVPLLDLIEVFQQRSDELGGAFDENWELFWRFYGFVPVGVFPPMLFAEVAFFKKVISSLMIKSLESSRILTEEDIRIHRQKISSLYSENVKVLLFAHSQGNLFANKVYEYAKEFMSPDRLRVIHIAPPIDVLKGEYILSHGDVIINKLRERFGNVPQSNTELAPSDDVTGHGLLETYLSKVTGGHDILVNKVTQTLKDMKSVNNSINNQGLFTVTMTWSGVGDIDLHVKEPNSDLIFFGKKQGQTGYLDIDNIRGYGPEHYFASCDSQKIQLGEYQVYVHNYNAPYITEATVQISHSSNGVLYTSPAITMSDKKQILVAKVSIEKIQGRYIVSIKN